MHLLPSGQGEIKAGNMGVIDNHKCLEVNLKDTGWWVFGTVLRRFNCCFKKQIYNTCISETVVVHNICTPTYSPLICL